MRLLGSTLNLEGCPYALTGVLSATFSHATCRSLTSATKLETTLLSKKTPSYFRGIIKTPNRSPRLHYRGENVTQITNRKGRSHPNVTLGILGHNPWTDFDFIPNPKHSLHDRATSNALPMMVLHIGARSNRGMDNGVERGKRLR